MRRTITYLKLLAASFTACLVTGPSLFAQTSGGPDTYGYVWRDNNDPNGPVYNWIDISTLPNAVEVTGLADDNIKGPFAIGFPFHFYWYDVTTFYVGSNGYMGFTATPVAHPFPSVPDPTGIQNYLPAMASDLTFRDPNSAPVPGAGCFYWTSPAADTLILMYENVPFWDPNAPGYTGANTFEIILSAVDSSVTYQYLSQNGFYNNPANFCTIGIENNSGNIGLMHSHDILPPSVYAIKFYYPSSTSFVVNDASTMYNNNTTTGGLFLSKNGAPFTMNTQIKNTGNQTLPAFNVFSRVVNPLNVAQASGTLQSSALTPGQTEDLIFPTPFLPTTAGTFRYINDTQLAGDATPSNNQKVMELQVVDTNQTNIVLSFDNGVDAGLGGLSWQGGGGGAAIEYVPPFYPFEITELRAFIAANANLQGFAMMVVDDDGPNGAPLTVLDSVWVDPASVLTGAWNNVPLPTPLPITSGHFYVAWMMGGDGISIGQNQVPPFSYRTFEVLGPASNAASWADYRYREIEDLMINVVISPITIGLNENTDNTTISELYPNPANESVSFNYTFENSQNSVSYSLINVQGATILGDALSTPGMKGTVNIDLQDVASGLYLLQINAGNEMITRRVSVTR